MGFIVNGYGGVDVFLILVNELLWTCASQVTRPWTSWRVM